MNEEQNFTDLYLEELKKTHIDFSDTKSMSSLSIGELYDKAKVQEKYFVSKLPTKDKFGNRYTILTIEDWCNVKGVEYSHKIDLECGDVVVVHKGNVVLYIDLKVGIEKYAGTPQVSSVMYFGVNLDPKRTYYCCRIDGSMTKIINAHDLYNAVFTGSVDVMVSYNRRKLSSTVNSMRNRVRLFKPKRLQYADMDKLYDEDFVTSPSIEKF